MDLEKIPTVDTQQQENTDSRKCFFSGLGGFNSVFVGCGNKINLKINKEFIVL